MNRPSLFNEDAICSICGKKGAYNDHGEWLCSDHLKEDDESKDIKECTAAAGHFWNANLSVNIRIEHEESCVHCEETRMVPGIPIPPSIPGKRPSWIKRTMKRIKNWLKSRDW